MMKKLFAVLFCFFSLSNSLHAQTYSIPWAQQQPQWVFPLWFENGDGQKDTIYFAYDSDGIGLPHDTIFGDRKFILDTLSFNAFIDCYWDTAYQVNKSSCTGSAFSLANGISICFLNGQLPLILKWDKNLFYTDLLPFPNQNPLPTAWGILNYNSPMDLINGFQSCNFNEPVFMTDTIEQPSSTCHGIDSLYFTGTGVSSLQLRIRKWQDYNSTEVIKRESQLVTCYPNPSEGIINIKMNSEYPISLSIYNIIGQREIDFLITKEKEKIDLSSLAPGIYFFQFTEKENFISQNIKVVKL